MAFDGNGNLYIANHGANTISEVTPAGAVSTFVSASQGLNGPGSLAFDSSGNLYIANTANSTISKVTPGGTVSTFIASSQANFGVNALTIDSADNLYIAGNDEIGKVALTSSPTALSIYYKGSTSTQSLAVDTSGNLYTISSHNTISTFSLLAAPVAANGITVRSSVPTRPMSLGGPNNAAVAGINLTNAELAAMTTLSTGGVDFGDEDQTGNIYVNMATLATTPGSATTIGQSSTGSGQIVLNDGNGTFSALNGNGGSIELFAGTGGIVAASANNNTAEIVTTGPSVFIVTTGPVGTLSNRIQFADNANSAQQVVTIDYASAIYLDGLGNLTLGTLITGPDAPIDVTARTNLIVNAHSSIQTQSTSVNTISTLSLGADMTPAETGDDAVGTLNPQTCCLRREGPRAAEAADPHPCGTSARRSPRRLATSADD